MLSPEYPVPTSNSHPGNITSGPDGALWFTEGRANQIGRIDPTTHVVTEYPLPTSNSGPAWITSGPDGALWFTEAYANKIGKVLLSTVPGAPRGVKATAGDAQAKVSFKPPASDGGSPITSYTVTSKPQSIKADGTSSPIVVTGLTNGTAYTFKVKATNAVGTGPASIKSNTVTPAKVPGQPRGVTATAGDAQATASFKAPTSNGGSPITSLHGDLKP